MRPLEDKAFLLVLAAVSLAFAAILAPFSGAILWSVVFAIVFTPLYRTLRLRGRQGRNIAALETIVLVVVLVIVPLILIGSELLAQATSIYRMVQSGQLNVGQHFQDVYDALPRWAIRVLEKFELTNLTTIRERVSELAQRSTQFLAAQAFSLGHNTVSFALSLLIMLYLLFVLLRDGAELSLLIQRAVPLRAEQQQALIEKFTVVIRATVKGNLAVAVLQGLLGGLAFWFLGIKGSLLWGSLMAILSLLPMVGAILVWGPVAVYYLSTGNVWHGIALAAYGTLVIGMTDYILRPMLVQRETQLPDYLVLLATLGGLAVFGINGFIIGPIVAAMFVAVWHIFGASRSAPRPRAVEIQEKPPQEKPPR